MRNKRSLVVFVALTLAAGALGSLFPPGEWYAQLSKPSWTPPNWLFGPVWTILYVMIGIAGWRIATSPSHPARKPALAAWGTQLVLNGLWSWLFFGLHRPDLAFVDISLLWLAIALAIGLAWRFDRWAAGLLVPYLAWVSFAAALNGSIWQANPVG